MLSLSFQMSKKPSYRGLGWMRKPRYIIIFIICIIAVSRRPNERSGACSARSCTNTDQKPTLSSSSTDIPEWLGESAETKLKPVPGTGQSSAPTGRADLATAQEQGARAAERGERCVQTWHQCCHLVLKCEMAERKNAAT